MNCKQSKDQERLYVRKIKQAINKEALGYEGSCDFARGIVKGLVIADKIDLRFARELIANFADSDGEPETLDEIEAKYGRILS